MHNPGIYSLRVMRVGFAGALLVCGAGVWACQSKPQPQSQPAPGVQPLSANDVSWLFPAPTQAADFANLIAVRDITTPDPQDPTKRDPVWSDAAFQQFLAIADGPRRKPHPAQPDKSLCPRRRKLPTLGSSPEYALTRARPDFPATFGRNMASCRKFA